VSFVVEHAIAIAASGRRLEDRAIAIPIDGGIVIAVADGAGGTGNGAVAAQAIIDVVAADPSVSDWAAALVDLDDPARLGGGQATAVIATVTTRGIVGASVGDSAAWIVRDGAVVDLTCHQERKPLVGDGCSPTAFGAELGDGTLVIATDGLVRYAIAKDIVFVVERGEPLEHVAHRLVDLVRLPSGGLQDDVAIVVCRAS
jgi:PPM family protein phosphatase